MYFVYILKSQTANRYYIGCTQNLVKRVNVHNKGRNLSTKSGIPWELILYKAFLDKKEAFRAEKLIKSYKGGNQFKRILLGEVAEWSKAPHC